VQIDYKVFNIVDSVNLQNSIVTLVSGVPEIEKKQIIGNKHGGSSGPENMDLVRRFWYLHSTRSILDDVAQWLQLRQIPTREYSAPRNLTRSIITLAHLLFITYRFIQMRLQFGFSFQLTSSHIHHCNQPPRKGIDL